MRSSFDSFSSPLKPLGLFEFRLRHVLLTLGLGHLIQRLKSGPRRLLLDGLLDCCLGPAAGLHPLALDLGSVPGSLLLALPGRLSARPGPLVGSPASACGVLVPLLHPLVGPSGDLVCPAPEVVRPHPRLSRLVAAHGVLPQSFVA